MKDGEEPVDDQISNLSLNAMSENETGKSEDSVKAPTINGAAIFQADRLIGWLNNKEARGILWIRNALHTGTLTITVSDETIKGKIGADIVNISTNIKPVLNNNKIKIKIIMDGEIEIFENTSHADLSDPKVINDLQKEFEKDVKKEPCSNKNKIKKSWKRNEKILNCPQIEFKMPQDL